MNRTKLAIAVVVYLLAFVAHLIFIYAFLNEKTYAEWQSLLRGFGGKPFPGTDILLLTLKAWWLYPVAGLAVFVYVLIMRRRLLLSVTFMVAVALLFAVYFEGPVARLGSIV